MHGHPIELLSVLLSLSVERSTLNLSVNFMVKLMKITSELTFDTKSKHQDASGIFVMPAVNLLAPTKVQRIFVLGRYGKRSSMPSV